MKEEKDLTLLKSQESKEKNIVMARPLRHLEAVPVLQTQEELDEDEYIDGVSRIVITLLTSDKTRLFPPA